MNVEGRGSSGLQSEYLHGQMEAYCYMVTWARSIKWCIGTVLRNTEKERHKKYEIRQCVKGKVGLISVALVCFGKVTEENHDKHQNAETIWYEFSNEV